MQRCSQPCMPRRDERAVSRSVVGTWPFAPGSNRYMGWAPRHGASTAEDKKSRTIYHLLGPVRASTWHQSTGSSEMHAQLERYSGTESLLLAGVLSNLHSRNSVHTLWAKQAISGLVRAGVFPKTGEATRGRPSSLPSHTSEPRFLARDAPSPAHQLSKLYSADLRDI